MSIVSREIAQAIARINSRVRVVHLEGASHNIRRHSSESTATSNAVEEWIVLSMTGAR